MNRLRPVTGGGGFLFRPRPALSYAPGVPARNQPPATTGRTGARPMERQQARGLQEGSGTWVAAAGPGSSRRAPEPRVAVSTLAASYNMYYVKS